MSSPLDHIRVLELATRFPGPFAGMLLADLGAEVIKVEPPLGDPLRHIPPPTLFGMVNRNKSSVVLNLKTEEGQKRLKQMAQQADVLLEGFKPKTMEQWGISYPQLKAPQLIYCALTGYGQTGKRAFIPGHDINYQALSGILSLGGPSGIPLADLGGALYAVIAILSALLLREKTKKGTFLDIGMLQGITSLLSLPLGEYLGTGPVKKEGLITGGFACYHLYETKDSKKLAIGALEDKFWRNFCKAVGRSDWTTRQYEGDQARLIEEVAGLIRTKTQTEWNILLEGKETCVEPVRELEEVVQDPGLTFSLEGLLQWITPLAPLSKKKMTPAPPLGFHQADLPMLLGQISPPATLG